MLAAVLSGIILALLLIPFGRIFKGKLSVAVTLLPLSLFAYFAGFIPEIAAGETLSFTYSWIPKFGVDLSFYLDGLSLLFALMITGVGTLVFFYTSGYMKGHEQIVRFYGYLSLFMAAMLGLVLSDNLIGMFVFWEMTSISSFFLIGFNSQDDGSRKSAITALSITGAGGLFLLAGFILIGTVFGTYDFQEMLTSSTQLPGHELYPLILIFIFGGAFTKSGQFPFHFWLPGAMKAPTPVSTYLHSATMVKAGIYVLLRFTPLLSGDVYWHGVLTVIGGITMVYCAFHTLFRTDMKGILAYSTLSALGIIVFLIGIGTDLALQAALTFILVHALYKATLFLVTGIVDHETGTREVPRLAGLGKLMIPVAIAAFLAAFSNAGIPPFFGFIGKDLIYEAALHAGSLEIILVIAAVVSKILLAYAGYVVGVKPFIGKLPEEFSKVHMPPLVMWLPPFLLAAGCLVFGLVPAWPDEALVTPGVAALTGNTADALKLFHGFNTVLILSIITIILGVVMYFVIKPSKGKVDFIARFDRFSTHSIIENAAKGFQAVSYLWTRIFQNGFLRFYVLSIIIFFIILVGYKLLTGVDIYVNWSDLLQLTFYETSILAMMLVAIFFAVFASSRLSAIVAMGIVGFSMCLLFVFYSAPDLAMTQFAIDTLTVILFVLILFRLPKYLPFNQSKTKYRDAGVSLIFGGLITLLALEVLNEPMNTELGDYFAEASYIEAKGKNVVNVILVDFRGMDTMIEITVLAVAAIGVFGLLKLKLSDQEPEL